MTEKGRSDGVIEWWKDGGMQEGEEKEVEGFVKI